MTRDSFRPPAHHACAGPISIGGGRRILPRCEQVEDDPVTEAIIATLRAAIWASIAAFGEARTREIIASCFAQHDNDRWQGGEPWSGGHR